MFRHSIGAILRQERATAICSFKGIKLRLLPDDGTCGVLKHVGGDFVYLLGIGYSHVNYQLN